MARGATRRPTATCGIRRSRPTGARTTTAIGLRFRAYGWTWIGFDVWAWPTHHYGRWGFARTAGSGFPARRGARPGSRGAAAPGYVSWCPLGFDNRPVFAFGVSFGNPWRMGRGAASRTSDQVSTSITTALPPAAIPVGRRLSSRRARRLHRLLPCRDHERSRDLRRAARYRARARAPLAVPPARDGSRRRVCHRAAQPELGGARAISRGRPSAAAVRPRARARVRPSPPSRRPRQIEAGADRYAPDNAHLAAVRRRPSRVERHHARLPRTTVRLVPRRRSYPPVTTTRPRTEQQSTVAPSPSPGYRAAPAQRAQPVHGVAERATGTCAAAPSGRARLPIRLSAAAGDQPASIASGIVRRSAGECANAAWGRGRSARGPAIGPGPAVAPAASRPARIGRGRAVRRGSASGAARRALQLNRLGSCWRESRRSR